METIRLCKISWESYIRKLAFINYKMNKGRYESLVPVVEINMQKLKARAKCRLENSAFVYTGKLKKIPHSLLM